MKVLSSKSGAAEPEYVTFREWDSYARRIERANLRRDGRSLSFTGIAARAQKHIIECQRGGMVVRPGWRQAMREAGGQ